MNTTYPHPVIDNDTLDVLDHAISTLARRRGLWLNTDAVFLHLIASLINQAQNALPHIVLTARENGTSWDDIAQLLATTPEQAKHEYDPSHVDLPTEN